MMGEICEVCGEEFEMMQRRDECPPWCMQLLLSVIEVCSI